MKRLGSLILSVMAAAILIVPCMSVPVSAEPADCHIYDLTSTDVLSDSEEDTMEEKLAQVSLDNEFDVIVVYTDDLEGYDIMDMADDFYDYSGFGYGSNNDGCLLLVSLEKGNNQMWLSTTGYGITAFTDAGISYVEDEIADDLHDGNYVEAIVKFADLTDDFVKQAKKGTPYDSGNLPKHFSLLFILIGLAIGAVISGVIVLVIKSGLTTVVKKTEANDYLVKDSLVINRAFDRFVTKRVDRRAKPKDTSGSSTHTGSSGTSHGGGGRSF